MRVITFSAKEWNIWMLPYVEGGTPYEGEWVGFAARLPRDGDNIPQVLPTPLHFSRWGDRRDGLRAPRELEGVEAEILWVLETAFRMLPERAMQMAEGNNLHLGDGEEELCRVLNRIPWRGWVGYRFFPMEKEDDPILSIVPLTFSPGMRGCVVTICQTFRIAVGVEDTSMVANKDGTARYLLEEGGGFDRSSRLQADLYTSAATRWVLEVGDHRITRAPR